MRNQTLALAPAGQEEDVSASQPTSFIQQWPATEEAAAPYWAFSDEAIYQREQEKIFQGDTWNFLCLEIDVKNTGDVKLGKIGEMPVFVTKDENGTIRAFENRCAHKGALVCLEDQEAQKSITCVYHAWNYRLDGTLRSVAFKNGVNGKGGMPADFDESNFRLRPLRVEVFAGIVWGTLSETVEPLERFLGERTAGFLKRTFNRPVKVLGRHTQIIHNNWKLYAENVRDSYHATLLHTFYTAFKVNRLDMDGGILLSDSKWHHISYSKRTTLKENEEYQNSEVHSAQMESVLESPQLLDSWIEFDDQTTHSIQTVFPNLVVQFTLNSLAIRFFAPVGVDKTELHWIFLGFEDDTEEQTAMRVRQANLTGAAGLVALEDGCINSFVQRGTKSAPSEASFIQMGGKKAESNESSRATEAAVRGFWSGYRDIMGFAE